MEERKNVTEIVDLTLADLIDLTHRGKTATARLIELFEKNKLEGDLQELRSRNLRYIKAYDILTRKESINDPPNEAA